MNPGTAIKRGDAARAPYPIVGGGEPVDETLVQRRRGVDDDVKLVARARALYRERRRRDATMDMTNALFGEPSWDILLDLFVAEGSGKTVSVSSACLASTIPQSTALRYIGLLERQGLVQRTPDPRDGRRYYLSLTGAAQAKMRGYLRGAGDIG